MFRIILILIFIFFWDVQIIWGITLPPSLERFIAEESSPEVSVIENNNISTAVFENPCKRSGLACKSCSEVIKCIEIFPEYYEEYPIKRCSEGETCLINQCSSAHNPKCANKETFSCVATSLFPDPYDCQIFHICVLAKDIIVPLNSNEKATDFHVAVKCAGNYAYNINTHMCDIPLQDGTCSDNPPIPDCSNMPLGFAKALGPSPYYFMCIDNGSGQLRPIIHVCPHGKRYVATGKCDFVDKIDKNIQKVDNSPSATETKSVWVAPPPEILQNINNPQMNFPMKQDSEFTTEKEIKQAPIETTKIVIPPKKYLIGMRFPPRKMTKISSNIPENESAQNSLKKVTDNQALKSSGNSGIQKTIM